MEILTIPLDPSVVTWHFNCVLFSLCKSKWKKNGFYGKFHLKIYGTSEFLGFLSSYFVKKLFDCQTKFSCLAQNFLIVSVIIVSVEWAVAPGWPIKSHLQNFAGKRDNLKNNKTRGWSRVLTLEQSHYSRFKTILQCTVFYDFPCLISLQWIGGFFTFYCTLHNFFFLFKFT